MTPGIEICGVQAGPGETVRQWVKVADSAGGPLHLPLILVAGARPGPTIYIQSGLHGDEYDGLEAALRMADGTDPADLAGNLVIVTRANVPAFVSGSRLNRQDGMDMNAIWPGRADGYLTERLVHFIYANIVPHIDCAIDLHGGNTELQVVSYGNWQDAPGFDALACATVMGLKHLWDWTETLHRQPIFTKALQALGIPSLVIEIGGGNRWSEASVLDGVRAMRNVMRHLGMIGGDYDGLPDEVLVMAGGFVTAPAGGFLRPRCQLNDTVRKGQVLGEIVDLLGRKVGESVSPRDGVVNDVRTLPRILPGDWMYMVGEIRRRIPTAPARQLRQSGFRRPRPS
jgi:predicted deacylase